MRLENCPKCGGRLISESIGWKCEKCKGFIGMNGSFYEYIEKPFLPPMTNADRIRAMSDEELSEFLWCFDLEEVSREASTDWIVRRQLVKWLQQPVEVE